MLDGDKTALLKIMDDYVEHLTNYPNSLLGRYYGMFRIRTPFFNPVYIVLMANVTKMHDPSK